MNYNDNKRNHPTIITQLHAEYKFMSLDFRTMRELDAPADESRFSYNAE